MINLIIRPLLSSEAAILDDMLYEAIFVPEGYDPFPRTVIHDPSVSLYIDSFGTKKDDYCFVAEVDDQIVGAVWIRLLNGVPKGYGNVDDTTPEFAISLYPQFRGKGIGTKLMETMIRYMKHEGYKQTSLSVQKANYAVSLYKNVGFEIVEVRDEDYLMVLKLN